MASRLVQYERKQALKSAFLYLILTAGVLYGLTRFGTDIVTGVTSVLNTNKESPNSKNASLVPPPQLESTPEITNQKIISIQGYAPSGITVRLTLNGAKQDIVSNAQSTWSIEFPLNEGENLFRVQAVDNQGNLSQEIMSNVTLDTKPPALVILEPESGLVKSGKKELTLEIKGTTDADASAKINDRVVIVDSEGAFIHSITLLEGENLLNIVATDRAGNKTEEVRTVTYSL